MKKKLILICSILLVIGCYKTEPKQDENIQVVKTTSVVEDVEVAGASYNPNVQGAENEIVVEKVEEEVVETKVPTHKTKPVTKTTKKTKPIIIPEPSEANVDVAIQEDLEEKIKIDEEITKETEIVVVSEEVPIEETPKNKSSIIYIILGAVAAAGAGMFFFKGKTPPTDDDVS